MSGRVRYNRTGLNNASFITIIVNLLKEAALSPRNCPSASSWPMTWPILPA
jgi:hypothetical protein